MPLPELSHTYHRKNGIPKSVKQYEFFQMTKRALVVLWRVNFAGHERGKNLEDPHATSIIRKRGKEGVKVLDHRTGRDCPADRILWVSRDRSNALFYLPAIQDPENRPVYIAVYWNAPITCWSIQEQKLQQMFVNTSMLLKWLLATVPLNGQSRQRSLWGETKTLTSKAFWLVNSRSWCLELLQFHTYKICFSIYPTYINLSTSASR